ncbi:MAG: sulfatase-like hydrolase/transferase [Rhodothermales bacterium]
MRRLPTILLTCLLLGGCTQETPKTQTADSSQPNFLFLFADDQAFDTIQAFGHAIVQTPNLDKLVSSGMTFTHAFNQGSWSGAVCVVSRAMLNSGRYIYHAREDIDRVPLWGETFSDAGYNTFLTGKWHNGDDTALRSFDQAMSIGKGMFETTGGPKGAGYRRPTPGNQSWSPSDSTLLGHWSPNVKDIVDGVLGKTMSSEYVADVHTSTLYANQAIDFLDSWETSSEQPFMMYVAFNAPHDPRQAPQEFVDMYPLEDIALPANFLPEHPFDQGERYTLRDEILAPFPRTENAIKTHIQEYYAIISHMDYEIGRILDRLEALDIADNTYIIFTADHGLAVGQHGLVGKQNQYDHSIRVPLVISGPNVAPGASTDALVYLQSIYPTTCDLAGIPTPSTVEFKSLLPLIEESAGDSYDAIFGSYKDFQRMVRTKDFKLILYPEEEQVQLFDMNADPLEMTNLAKQAAYQDTMAALFGKLQSLQKEVGDTLSLREM